MWWRGLATLSQLIALLIGGSLVFLGTQPSPLASETCSGVRDFVRADLQNFGPLSYLSKREAFRQIQLRLGYRRMGIVPGRL
ncbi:uncharacterized protein BKA55DRAFT_579652 [Fusarium redolens]|jgi:hypothetical protein|uniref:Uncharacterized protein n=1 Tax=Fusarium redolens TaxID=48865 RepID=A0A9P9JRC2_FUSRE|nr:uncharacterized protein BKA55DRAFT_579652 [Fusarium redolens]KAH7234912.1 hypothetical protein BKA55DRAFT_579652 [Fusarium redolens]